ncbi:uncharacterized protein LOC131415129 [Diceros bicornis minor]|uniref:uncharacterized protein LOC131415129 n=1 Tax=Diceros bicornis minor TaxID=77932 RepID=UPI0026F1B272|nr:uncharacterized protein LOC131415129 [Diceros bicornis minor]
MGKATTPGGEPARTTSPVLRARAQRPRRFLLPRRRPGVSPWLLEPRPEASVGRRKPARRRRSGRRAAGAGGLCGRSGLPAPRARGLPPRKIATAGAPLATPNNRAKERQTHPLGGIYLDDAVLGAILKCLLDFSVCWSLEYCRPVDPLGSRRKRRRAGDEDNSRERRGERTDGKSLGRGQPRWGRRGAARPRSRDPRRVSFALSSPGPGSAFKKCVMNKGGGQRDYLF